MHLGISGDRMTIILVWLSKKQTGRGEAARCHLLEKPEAEFTLRSSLTANLAHLAGVMSEFLMQVMSPTQDVSKCRFVNIR